MVIRVSDKTQNYSKVTKLLVKPNENRNSQTSVQEFVLNLAQKKHLQFAKSIELNILQIHLTTEGV